MMALQPNLPASLWGFALRYAAEVLAVVGTDANEGLSPMEKLTHRTPTARTHPRPVWGCKVSVLKEGDERHGKLDTKTDLKIFVGIEGPAYLLKERDSNQVRKVSRHKCITIEEEFCRPQPLPETADRESVNEEIPTTTPSVTSVPAEEGERVWDPSDPSDSNWMTCLQEHVGHPVNKSSSEDCNGEPTFESATGNGAPSPETDEDCAPRMQGPVLDENGIGIGSWGTPLPQEKTLNHKNSPTGRLYKKGPTDGSYEEISEDSDGHDRMNASVDDSSRRGAQCGDETFDAEGDKVHDPTDGDKVHDPRPRTDSSDDHGAASTTSDSPNLSEEPTQEFIPETKEEESSSEDDEENETVVYTTVKDNETPSSVAAKFNCKPADIVRLNEREKGHKLFQNSKLIKGTGLNIPVAKFKVYQVLKVTFKKSEYLRAEAAENRFNDYSKTLEDIPWEKMTNEQRRKLADVPCPHFYEAMVLPDWRQRLESARKENQSFIKLKVYTEVEWDERDPTATILDLIEVYTVKFDANGIYTKHKNRVAAGGHRSVSGKDYDHGHVDGVGAEEIRLFGALIAVALHHHLFLLLLLLLRLHGVYVAVRRTPNQAPAKPGTPVIK